MNIEDTSLLDDIKKVQKASQQLLAEDQIVPQHLMDRAFDNDTAMDDLQAEKTTEQTDDEDTAPIENESTQAPKKERKMKKTELENLKIDNWEPPRTAKRTTKISSLVNSTTAFHCMPPIIGLELKSNKHEEGGVGNESNKHEEGGVGNESNFLEGEEVLNENNPVLLM